MAGRFVKFRNSLSSGYSFLHSTMSGKPLIRGMPPAISAELTNHCNLACPECASGSGLMKRDRGFMEAGLFRKLIDELEKYLFNINLYFQGEPMMHPDFFSFLENAKRIRTTVSTNGHFLDAELSERIVMSGLDELIVSLDGMDQAIYSRYRINGDFGRVTEGIKNMALARKKLKSSMKLEIQFLVNRHNENQIARVRKFAGENGAALKLKSMQVISNKDAGDWIPSEDKYSRYLKRSGGYVIKSRLPDRCARLWFNPVVTWDGKVLPCCFDKEAAHVMGDLNLNTFREIWNGEEYDRFRRKILTGRSEISICRNCTSGLKGVKI